MMIILFAVMRRAVESSSGEASRPQGLRRGCVSEGQWRSSVCCSPESGSCISKAATVDTFCSSRDASELPAETCVQVRVGSFNFGVVQSQIESSWSKLWANKFANLVKSDFIKGYELAFVFGCEVGSHKKGFDTAKVSVEDLLGDNARVLQNYLATWSEEALAITPLRPGDVIELPGTTALEAQLAPFALK